MVSSYDHPSEHSIFHVSKYPSCWKPCFGGRLHDQRTAFETKNQNEATYFYDMSNKGERERERERERKKNSKQLMSN